MDIGYEFPGPIEVTLDLHDLTSLHDPGFTVERDGFSGTDSKTWIHLEPLNINVPSKVNDNHALIEPGGDLHVYLKRGCLWPVTIEQSCIEANDDLIAHYLGEIGTITVRVEG